MKFKLKIVAALAAFTALLMPGVGSAHVTVSPTESPAEGYAMLNFVVPHGCDDAATTSVAVKMPAQVISATPGVVAGWQIKAKEGKLPQPAEQHGETITEGVRQVTWTGGPLDPHQLEQFPLSVAFSGAEGDVAEFKVIQGCEGGKETAWIQTTVEGEEEPESPAPFVTLTAAGDEHGSVKATNDGEAEAMVEAEPASGSDSGDSGDGLAIAALIVGALGLLAGGGALITARRSAK